MTRRGIIAGVILLAAVVVAVPFAPGVWDKVAYREVELGNLLFLKKRWDWLPGGANYVPDQVCGSCLSDQHIRCAAFAMQWSDLIRYRDLPMDEAGIDTPDGSLWWCTPRPGFRCTCTDPSHDRD